MDCTTLSLSHPRDGSCISCSWSARSDIKHSRRTSTLSAFHQHSRSHRGKLRSSLIARTVRSTVHRSSCDCDKLLTDASTLHRNYTSPTAMPTDYTSTARSLALPISPLHSPTTTRAPPRKFWPRTASYASNRVRSPSPYSNGNSRSVRDSVLSQAEKWRRWIFRMFFKLSPVQQIASVFALLVTFVLGVLFLVYNEQIFQWLEPFAENWASIRGGWLILWFMIFVTAFPPIIGYSTCLTISGFVYGFPQGYILDCSHYLSTHTWPDYLP